MLSSQDLEACALWSLYLFSRPINNHQAVWVSKTIQTLLIGNFKLLWGVLSLLNFFFSLCFRLILINELWRLHRLSSHKIIFKIADHLLVTIYLWQRISWVSWAPWKPVEDGIWIFRIAFKFHVVRQFLLYKPVFVQSFFQLKEIFLHPFTGLVDLASTLFLNLNLFTLGWN